MKIIFQVLMSYGRESLSYPLQKGFTVSIGIDILLGLIF